MPLYLRALVVVLAIAGVVFAVSRAQACALATAEEDFRRRRNLWILVTLVAFLSHSFWLYVVAAGAIAFYGQARDANKPAIFYLLLFAVPPISVNVPGFGVVNYLFAMDHIRLLALAILFPAFLSLRRQPGTDPFGALTPDLFVLGYLLLGLALELKVDTVTNALRHGVFDAFLDIFLPYYVASRALRDLPSFRDALMAFVIAGLILGGIGAFEYAKHWLLYADVRRTLGVAWQGLGDYLRRAGDLRAQGSPGDPIALGYVIAITMGLSLYLRSVVPRRGLWGLGMVLLAAGLIGALSRGPWVGAAVIVLVYVLTGPSPARGLVSLALICAIALPLLLLSPASGWVIDHLPFVGTIDERNVIYREQLLGVALDTIREHLLFGDPFFMNSLAMQTFKRTWGFLDIVNTYLEVALGSGLVGLSLFVGFFLAAGLGIMRGMRRLADKEGELYILGRSLLATLIGIMVIIFTCSSISVIPVLYWSVAGFGVAYARMILSPKGAAAEKSRSEAGDASTGWIRGNPASTRRWRTR